MTNEMKKNIGNEIKPTKENLLETIIRVLRNYIEYGSYKKNKKLAIKAILKLHPDEGNEKVERYFMIYEEVFLECISNLDRYLKQIDKSEMKVSEFNDIDYESLNKYLKLKFPKSNISGIRMITNWVIFWHYLK
ncbi:MAG TPA: hypothetical protein PLH15_02920 [Spirochaetota bacterium]|nr:hypothetical protein [Spirochaetota bacterium]HQQ22772.1 hypothetical protein [Spirochaetota bacterium]